MHTKNQASSAPSGFLWVDNSNLWLGGQTKAAVEQGLACSVQDALTRHVRGHYRVSFSKLYHFFAGPKCRLKKALLAGSVAPNQHASVAHAAERAGFEAKFFTRWHGVEKQVDTSAVELVVAAMKLGDPDLDDITILSGDLDMLPFIEQLRSQNFCVDVAAWEHCTSAAVRQAASRFLPLDDFFHHFEH